MKKFYGIILSILSLLLVSCLPSDSSECQNISNFFANYNGIVIPECCNNDTTKKSNYIKCENGSITDIDLRLGSYKDVIDFSNFPILQNLKNLLIENANFLDNTVPYRIFEFPNLKTLGIYASKITRLMDISETCNLEELKLYNNSFSNFPNQVIKCSGLKKIDLSVNPGLTNIPKDIYRLTNLKQLYLGETGLLEIPNDIYKLKLEDFDINHTPCLSSVEIHKFAEPVDICDFRGDNVQIKCYEQGACKQFVIKEYSDSRDTIPENPSLYKACDESSNEAIRKISLGDDKPSRGRLTYILSFIGIVIILLLIFCYIKNYKFNTAYDDNANEKRYMTSPISENSTYNNDTQASDYNLNALKSSGSSNTEIVKSNEINEINGFIKNVETQVGIFQKKEENTSLKITNNSSIDDKNQTSSAIKKESSISSTSQVISPSSSISSTSPISLVGNKSFSSIHNDSFNSNQYISHIRSNSIHNTIPMKHTKSSRLTSKQIEALKCARDAPSKIELPSYSETIRQNNSVKYNQIFLQYQMNQLQNSSMKGINGINPNHNSNMPLYYTNIQNTKGVSNIQNSFIQSLPNAYMSGNMLNYGNGIMGSNYMNTMNSMNNNINSMNNNINSLSNINNLNTVNSINAKNINNNLGNGSYVTPSPCFALSSTLPTTTNSNGFISINNNININNNNSITNNKDNHNNS
ncbi:L domain-like protein [Piromyces finnis]|uniref:L domain-like protein n=1 Tax=Piromyces finnis TaxID=1754191 RepID=A0A1Y1VMG0_9FUNG|nr:L domain-like protein [Piromyces finnis]|eukprot:ORX60107.1 L domain-like protein [Piromyces finnis]